MSSASSWTPTLPVAELEVGGCRVVRAGGKQIAVFRPDAGSFYAVDNRCPHEGYPLAKGRVYGKTLLVCAWHNFTFDLRSGRCMAGDESVRTYPTRIAHGHLELDTADPDPTEAISGRFESLRDGLVQDHPGQAARDVVRLIQSGVSAEQILAYAVALDAELGEFGSTHALAVAADVLPMLPRYPGVRAVLPVMQVLEQVSDANVRREARRVGEAIPVDLDPERTGALLRDAVERWRIREAEGLMRGALAAGAGPDVVEPWLTQLCSDHLLAFGHALIYNTKLFDLLERVGWEHASTILPAHLYGVMVMPREDTIPSHAKLAHALASSEPELARWSEIQGSERLESAARESLIEAVLDGGERQALGAIEAALEVGVAASDLASALVVAASERLLRFEVAIDTDPSVQEGWLDVTHPLTFASAVRTTLERSREPGSLRLLLQAAHFVNRMRALDRRAAEAPVVRGDPSASDVVAALVERRPDEAAARARRHLGAGADPAKLRVELEDRILADHGSEPIFVAHYIKVVAAAFDELEVLGDDPARSRPVEAATRFLASPIDQRRLHTAALDALRFVEEGKTPRRLTPA